MSCNCVSAFPISDRVHNFYFFKVNLWSLISWCHIESQDKNQTHINWFVQCTSLNTLHRVSLNSSMSKIPYNLNQPVKTYCFWTMFLSMWNRRVCYCKESVAFEGQSYLQYQHKNINVNGEGSGNVHTGSIIFHKNGLDRLRTEISSNSEKLT